jgi:hypothetical protein
VSRLLAERMATYAELLGLSAATLGSSMSDDEWSAFRADARCSSASLRTCGEAVDLVQAKEEAAGLVLHEQLPKGA